MYFHEMYAYIITYIPRTSKPGEIISFIRSNSASFHLVTGCYYFQEDIRQYIRGWVRKLVNMSKSSMIV